MNITLGNLTLVAALSIAWFAAVAHRYGVQCQSDLELMISWRLRQDARSAAKRSKQIRLTVEAEAVRRYAAGSQDLRQRAHTRLVEFLREQGDRFHPEHDTPVGLPTPVERWVVNTRALFE